MSVNPTRQFARQARRETVGDAVARLGLYLALTAPAILWSGFALTRLWGWFAQPLGAPHLALSAAVGVNLLAAFLTQRTPPQEYDRGYASRAISFAALHPAFALGIGYLVHLASS